MRKGVLMTAGPWRGQEFTDELREELKRCLIAVDHYRIVRAANASAYDPGVGKARAAAVRASLDATRKLAEFRKQAAS